MLGNMSADATHRFQPFQPSSELVDRVDQPNQPKTVFSRSPRDPGFFPIEHEKTQPTQPTKNGWSQ